MTDFISIEQALEELRQGRMIILVDDEHRENEGDVMMAAEKITPQAINFMATHARGQICLALHHHIVDRLHIPLMSEKNKLPNQATFTQSIEAAVGISTGVSCFDRARTIQVAVNPLSTPQDISIPGHVFPLAARRGGILERPGHTEGSVDLAKLAGLQPAAVICEVMNPDGTMARRDDLKKVSQKHNIKLVAINDLIAYRFLHECHVHEVASSVLPLEYSPHFKIKIFKDKMTGREHPVLIHGEFNANKPPLVRIHSECLTGDVFGSLRCDCGEQLTLSLKKIAAEDGVILYLRQQDREKCLTNKIKNYELQTQSLESLEAKHELEFATDYRHDGLSAQILRALKLTKIRLLTNNPHRVAHLKQMGIDVIERLPLEVTSHKENIQYLKTKRDKLGHWLKLN